MSILSPWRQELKALIPRGFLRRDRENGLFISDYPRQGGAEGITCALEAAGYTVRIQEEAARIGVTEGKLNELMESLGSPAPAPGEDTLSLWALGTRLSSIAVPLSRQPVDLLYETLKHLDQGDLRGLEQYLRPRIALCQRRGLPLPGAAGKMILWALTQAEGEETPC